MAVVGYTITNKDIQEGCILVTWAAMGKGDTGKPFQIAEVPMPSDRSVHVIGTPDGETLTIEGTNEKVATTYTTLDDASGDALTFTTAGIKQILPICNWIRPSMSGSGAGASITVNLLMHVKRLAI